MKFLYNILMMISEKVVQLFGNFFGQKVRYFRQGQQHSFASVKKCLQSGKKTIWFHVSSLGEYEQALPVIEAVKEKYPDAQIALSFFSPSGYEIKKDKTPADCVFYLPIDTQKNARRLLEILQPAMVFFVKYDLWPNYLFALQKQQIPVYLISGVFKENHSFFKSYNAWLKKSLKAFRHFFVQDKASEKVLKKNGFTNITVTGDTRFDRVFQIAQKAQHLDFIEKFKQNNTLLVAGSTWPKDEELLLSYLNGLQAKTKTIIAPHEVDRQHIQQITAQLKRKYILYTDINDDTDLSTYEVLILNTIGLLNKVYKYADVVYIGNGFGKSIHNVQEPAVYGVPIVTGPQIHKFKEAVDLAKLGGLTVIKDKQSFEQTLTQLLQDESLRAKQAEITRQYALKNIGATEKIIHLLPEKL